MWLPATSILDPGADWASEENIDSDPNTYGSEGTIGGNQWGDELYFFPPATLIKEDYDVMPCCGIRFDAQMLSTRVNKIKIHVFLPLEGEGDLETTIKLYADHQLVEWNFGRVCYLQAATVHFFNDYYQPVHGMPKFYRFEFNKPDLHLYRGQDGIIDYNNIVAGMDEDDVSISIPNQALPPNTIWDFVRRRVSLCNLESADSPACRVIIDSNGDMLGQTPNKPLNLTIEKLAGAKLKLRWRYTRLGEEIAPTGFNIYMDSGDGFDFDTPADMVSFNRGVEFSWISDELVNGQTYRFCVRSYRTDAGESQNTNFVSAEADSQGPDAITDLQASWEEL